MTVRDPERLLVDVSLGRPKPSDLTREESDFWDRLKSQVDAIHSRGFGVEIPAGSGLERADVPRFWPPTLDDLDDWHEDDTADDGADGEPLKVVLPGGPFYWSGDD